METEDIRQTLVSEEERLSAIRADIRDSDDMDQSQQDEPGGETSTTDTADAGTEQMQREISLSLLEQVDAELSDIEHAMRKLDEGTYGTCDVCGKPIGDERLAAMPSARYCIEDQAKAEGASQGSSGAGSGSSPI